MLREWVVEGGGLGGYFGEQGLPVGIQECLDHFVSNIPYSSSQKSVPAMATNPLATPLYSEKAFLEPTNS